MPNHRLPLPLGFASSLNSRLSALSHSIGFIVVQLYKRGLSESDMEGISAAANVVGIIQLAGSIVKICGGYLREVKNARNDIVTLQQTVTDLELIVERLKKCLQGPCGTTLALSSGLVRGIASCHSDLETLKKSIDPGKGKDVMRRFGIRALRWPIDRREVDKSIQNLERYKSSFILFLQIDQTYVYH